MHTYYILIV